MGVLATYLAAGDVEDDEVALRRERQEAVGLRSGEAAAEVADQRCLDELRAADA